MTTTTKTRTEKRVRLLGLKVRNFNRLELVDVRFDRKGGLVQIKGRNAQGKSSLQDAFAWAFGGPRAIPQTSSPIRHGAKATEVLATTDAFTLERRATASGNRFAVFAPDGAEIKTSQAALDAMFSTLTFDPEAFGRMKPAEQRAALVRALGLEQPIAEIRARHDAAYEERRVVGRKYRDLEAQFKALPVPDMFDDPKELNPTELLGKIGEARDRERVRNEAERMIETKRGLLQAARGRIAALEAELELEREKVKVFGSEVNAATAFLDTLLPVPDVAELERALAGYEEHNAKARAAAAWQVKNRELGEVGEALEELEQTVARAREEQEELVAGAQLPVDGLRIEDEGLSLRGVPLAQCSSSERIRLGFAIALAQDPELRVCRILAGSLLDAEAQAEVDRLAVENDMLVLAEMVADEPDPNSGPDEIWIEDGRASQ